MHRAAAAAFQVLPPSRDCTKLIPSRHGALAARAVVVRVHDRKAAGMRRVGCKARDERVRARGHSHRRAPGHAVRRRRKHEVVLRAAGAEPAVSPRRVDRPVRVGFDRWQRDRAHRRVVGGLQVGDDEARERRTAVRRAVRDHRPAQRSLVAVVARDDDERAVRLHDRLRADENCAGPNRSRPRQAAVGRELAHDDVLLIVGVLEIAPALEGARGAVVAA